MRILCSLLMGCLAVSLWANPCDSPDVVFCSGFEEPNANSNWGSPKPMFYTKAGPGPFNIADNHVLHFPKNIGGNGSLDRIFADTGFVELYVRAYMKYEQGYDFSKQSHSGVGLRGMVGDGSSIGQSAGSRPDGDDHFGGRIEVSYVSNKLHLYIYYAGMECADPNNGCWGKSFPVDPADRFPVVADKWYCIEYVLNAGDPTPSKAGANGFANYWVDGQPEGPFTNMWFRSVPELLINKIQLHMYFHHDDGTAGIFFDDVIASTKPIGCGANTRVVSIANEIKEQRPVHRVSRANLAVEPGQSASSFALRCFVPEAGPVSLEVRDLHGRHVKSLLSGRQKAGLHVLQWDTRNVSDGIYICRLKVGGSSISRALPVIH